ncbi:hypothetical protein B0H17DRAFT_1202227 [Mycena rosella]|uniref:Uncharacterized protein n=1 Tax=Mycena rosella TaxID=1033263 RepID=A0AAD7DEQ6_MYCRO|nr:hypothetical protein B0H17DRAFT_1202227 [Mycena rosella]
MSTPLHLSSRTAHYWTGARRPWGLSTALKTTAVGIFADELSALTCVSAENTAREPHAYVLPGHSAMDVGVSLPNTEALLDDNTCSRDLSDDRKCVDVRGDGGPGAAASQFIYPRVNGLCSALSGKEPRRLLASAGIGCSPLTARRPCVHQHAQAQQVSVCSLPSPAPPTSSADPADLQDGLSTTTRYVLSSRDLTTHFSAYTHFVTHASHPSLLPPPSSLLPPPSSLLPPPSSLLPIFPIPSPSPPSFHPSFLPFRLTLGRHAVLAMHPRATNSRSRQGSPCGADERGRRLCMGSCGAEGEREGGKEKGRERGKGAGRRS